VKEVLTNYPLAANDVISATATFLYPQFELVLCFLAIQSAQTKKRRKLSSGPITLMAFAAKKTNHELSLSRMIHEFFKDIKIEKPSNFIGASRRKSGVEKIDIKAFSLDEASMSSDEEVVPQSSYPGMRCLDQYTSSLKHDRQAMLFKMQHLFTEVESLLLADPTSNSGSIIKIITINRNAEKSYSSSQRFASKPVVISDAIPLPSGQCSPLVEQLLQSALAHHNLGSYQEALDFLDGAKGQFKEPKSTSSNTDQVQEVQNRRMSPNQSNLGELPFEIEMYITLSKGNLYRSRDEDELAMVCYMGGWKRAQKIGNKEWGVIFVNSIGVLAYYSIRYDIALMCFDTVVQFREEEYGSESSDTATALNNEGCCLFCMHERGEARIRFERCWIAVSKVLGHRAPRSILMWQNLEKARRSNVATESKSQRKEIQERIHMRPDSVKLLIGGAFQIKAVAPPNKPKKPKKGGKKKAK